MLDSIAKLDTILPLYKQWGVAGMKLALLMALHKNGIMWLNPSHTKVKRFWFCIGYS